MSLRGLLAGGLMLAALELVVSTDAAAGRFGGLLTSIGAGVRYLLDPTIPAIPDRRPKKKTARTASESSSKTTGTVELVSHRHAPTPTVAVYSI